MHKVAVVTGSKKALVKSPNYEGLVMSGCGDSHKTAQKG